MFTRNWKRIVAMMLACVMMYTMLPLGVLAEEPAVADDQGVATLEMPEMPGVASTDVLEEDSMAVMPEEDMGLDAGIAVMPEVGMDEPAVEEPAEEEAAEPSEAEKLIAKIDNMLLRYLGDQFRDGVRTNEEILAEVNQLSGSEIAAIVNGYADNRFERLVAEVKNMQDAIAQLLAEDRAACNGRGVFAALCSAMEARKNSAESAALIEARETILGVNAFCGNADVTAMGAEELQSVISAINTMIMRVEYLDAVDRPLVEEQYGATIDALCEVLYAAEARLTEIDALTAFYAEMELFGMKYNVMAEPEILAEGMQYWELLDCKAEIKALENTINGLNPMDAAQFGHLMTFMADLKAAVQVRLDDLGPKLHSDSLRRDLLPLLEDAKELYCLPYTEEDLWIKLETKVALIAQSEDPSAAFTAIEKILGIYDQLIEKHKAMIDEEYGAEVVFLTELYADLVELAGTPTVMGRADSRFNTEATGGYYVVLGEKDYSILPGVTETEIVMNNVGATRRQLFRFFTINPKSESIELVPGYYGIDKFAADPTNKANYKDGNVTATAAYYEANLGYDIVGGMNTALAYDSNAPYSFLMWDGVVLQDKNDSFGLGYDWLNLHSGSCATYLAVKKDGTVELRDGSEEFKEDDWHCIGANFGWLVKDGKLVTTTVERTTSPASRSMIGIKADGTLILCQTDGRGANNSVGQSNYEMGEMMLALGCQWAFNCDGGGSSTFISQRAGEESLTMRSTPSDGAERATLNSIFIAKARGMTPGIFNEAVISSEYDYFAPETTYAFTAKAIDTTGAEMTMPEGGVWALSDGSFGTITDGVFVSNGTVGDVSVQLKVGGKTFEYPIHVVHPDVVTFGAEGTVIPYGKSVTLNPTVQYGADKWDVYYETATFSWTFSNENGTWNAETRTYTATDDESLAGPVLTLKYAHGDEPVAVKYNLEFGKGSEIVAGWNFENGDVSDWMGFTDAKAWSLANGVNNTLVGSDPLAGQFSSENDAHTFLATAENGQVKNGKYALGITYDNSAASFRGWTYNVLFNVGETRVFRDVANGLNATTLGFWLYIPEGGTGLAFQSQFNSNPAHVTDPTKVTCVQDHFMFTTVSGVRKNLNSCTEADIPANRWVYASIDISKYDYLSTMPATNESNSRSPSWMRTYIKPETPAKLTFYIDDITLDYSSAVEDRNAPVISGATYTTADEGVALADGAVIASNLVSFTASIAEGTGAGEVSGLNLASAKIYIDGNEVTTEASRNAMGTKGAVELADGQHRVTFEIEDNWYNRTQVSYEFTITGTQEALVVLGGHNDTGRTPDNDTVYYVDINTAAAENVAKVEAIIRLNTANTWELEHMTAAYGFDVEYELLDDDRSKTLSSIERSVVDIYSVENAVKVTLTRTEACTAEGEMTLLSIPVRVWSWPGFNNVTEQPEPAPFNKPTVTIDYTILSGKVTDIAGAVNEFGGFKSVATTMIGAPTPADYIYHTHTPVAMKDKAPTCTEPGYTGRTYCDPTLQKHVAHIACVTCGGSGKVDNKTCTTCKGTPYTMCEDDACTLCLGCGSVIDWGTTIPATGHVDTYTESKAATCTEPGYTDRVICNTCKAVVNPGVEIAPKHTLTRSGDQLVCTVCSETLTDTGLFEADGDYYYLIAGNITSGWHTIDGAWHYFRSSTKKAAQGTVRHQYGSVTFDLTYENGKLLSGVWVEVNGGMRYYYGPAYYSLTWADIDGAKYYFDQYGSRLVGYQLIKDSRYSHDDDYRMYHFGEDGKLLETLTADGLLVVDSGTYYLEGGYAKHKGLVLDNGDYYYFNSTRKAVTNGDYFVEITNDLLPAGTYEFGADGKMIKKNGIDGDYYYIDGVIQKTGLTKVGEDYYYFSTTNGKMRRSQTSQVNIVDKNCDLSVGTYTFGADGKVILPEQPDIPVEPEKKNGIIGDYYYIDDVIQKTGLIKVGDAYYYFSTTNGIMRRNQTSQVNIVHVSCDLPVGTYTFGADGKVILPEQPDIPVEPEKKNGIIGDYYYIDDVIQKTGLIKIGEDYYYFSTTNGIMRRNQTSQVNIVAPGCDLSVGTYTFGADGKVILPEQPDTPVEPEKKNGIIGNYYYINDVIQRTGLIKIGEDYYYFSTTNGIMRRNQTSQVNIVHASCDLPVGVYTFGEDGKMVKKNGIDGDYYYIDGEIQMTGLTKVGEDYYYFSTTNGKMRRSQTSQVNIVDKNCDLPVGKYTFGADGKVVLK